MFAVVLLIALIPAQFLLGSTCSDGVLLEAPPYFAPFLGESEPLPGIEFEVPTQTFLLSADGPQSQEGGMSKVYRVVPQNGPTYTLKLFRNQQAAKNELAGMRLLAETEGIGFKVAAAEMDKSNPLALNLAYIPGRDLNSLLRDPQIDAPLKTLLASRYQALVREYASAIRRLPGATLAGVLPDSKNMEYGITNCIFWISGRECDQLMLKPQQVVVSPVDLSMTIVDSF